MCQAEHWPLFQRTCSHCSHDLTAPVIASSDLHRVHQWFLLDRGGAHRTLHPYLMNSGGGEARVLSCVSIEEPTRLQRIAPKPRLHRQPWVNSLSHKTKQKDMNVGKGLGERVGRRQGGMGVTEARMHYTHM